MKTFLPTKCCSEIAEEVQPSFLLESKLHAISSQYYSTTRADNLLTAVLFIVSVNCP